jgi:hypothetical protein
MYAICVAEREEDQTGAKGPERYFSVRILHVERTFRSRNISAAAQ